MREESTKKSNSKKDGKCPSCGDKRGGGMLGNKKHVGNDPGWYTREGLVGIVGMNFSALKDSRAQLLANGNYSFQSSFSVTFPTHIGAPNDVQKSFYKMCTLMYAEIRERNSGASNYTPLRLAAYIHDMCTIRAMYIHMCRALSAARSAQVGNVDSPYYLINTVWKGNADDLINNLATYADQLQIIGKDLETLPIPYVSMLERQAKLYGTVFADSQSSKATFYAFVPERLIQCVGASTSFTSWIDNGKTMAEWIAQLKTMISNLTYPSDIAVMRGDIIKAYGYQPVDFTGFVSAPLRIEYDDDFMSQVENMNYLGSGYPTPKYNADGFMDVTCSFASSTVKASYRCTQYKWVVNYHAGMSPDYGTQLAITRMMTYVDADNNVYGTGDYVMDPRVNYDFSSGKASSYTIGADGVDKVDSTTQSVAVTALMKIANIATVFNRFPWVWIGNNTYTPGRNWVFDLDEWALIDETTLLELNTVCIRSLFYYRMPRQGGRF